MKQVIACLVLLLGAGSFWLAGLLWFSIDAFRNAPQPVRCDGIVALTGGKERVDTALHLLHDSYGRLLLISGVGPHATLTLLAGPSQHLLTDDLTARITLGRRAISTIGNGAETAEWVKENDLHSLLVVTASYHIRRAMTEIRRAAPDIVLHAYPVRSPAMRRPLDRATIRLLVLEYDKWIGAQFGLSRGMNLAPAR